MPNPSGNPASLTAPRFQPGKSGNPGGEAASRRRLTTRFLNALADDFEANGQAAIVECRTTNPAAYIKAIAALCPKEIEVKRPLQEMEDADLLAAVRALEGFLATRADAAGAGTPGSGTAVN